MSGLRTTNYVFNENYSAALPSTPLRSGCACMPAVTYMELSQSFLLTRYTSAAGRIASAAARTCGGGGGAAGRRGGSKKC